MPITIVSNVSYYLPVVFRSTLGKMNIRFNQYSIAKVIDPALHTVENQQLPYINVDVARTTKLVKEMMFWLASALLLVVGWNSAW